MDYFECKLCYYDDVDPFSTAATVAEPTIKPTFKFNKNIIIKHILNEIHHILKPPHLLENSVLQLCKFKENQVEYGPFLDFDLSLHEQQDESESLMDGRNTCVILRTKLAVRVEALMDKINNSDGKEMRRVLFSLKQVFQDDKDLVQEFVARRGLHCLRQVGAKSDQNHQNYILRALGQLMLYVDGMNGLLEDPDTIEWLYSLLQGKFRLVVKLALKLLVVFIEYAKTPELNASVIISAIKEYHRKTGGKPWSLTMKILSEADDSELMTYAIAFINKVLSALPDQDTFYDVTDWLEEQGIENISKNVVSKSNADVDMVKQFQLYETALKIEDGNDNLMIEHEGIRNLPRAKSENNLNRKSKRAVTPHDIEVENSSKSPHLIIDDQRKRQDKSKPAELTVETKIDSDQSDIDEAPQSMSFLRRASVKKRECDEFKKDMPKRHKLLNDEKGNEIYKSLDNLHDSRKFNKEKVLSSSPPSRPQSLLLEHTDNSSFLENVLNSVKDSLYSQSKENGAASMNPTIRILSDSNGSVSRVISPFSDQSSHRISPTGEEDNTIGKKEMSGDKPNEIGVSSSVKAMKNQFSEKVKTNEDTQKHVTPTGDRSNRIATAKDSLRTTIDKPPMPSKYLATELVKDTKVTLSNESPDWDKLETECAKKPLVMKEWNFSDLKQSDDDELDSQIVSKNALTNGVPPPPPPPPSSSKIPIPPAPGPLKPPSAPAINKTNIPGSGIQKQKRTTRLHWRVFNPDYCGTNATIWNKVKPVTFEPEKFESLFEIKLHDVKKELKQETGPKKIEVLDLKRSNAINIGMTALPSIQSIKSAILTMHNNTINREGVEKLLTSMSPTQEEIDNIKTAQQNNKDAPLGQAESFLLELSEVNLLQARLEVWLFQLDFDQIERDIMDSLMDLMRGIKEIDNSKTLVYALSTILTLGNFLNGSQATSFSLEYLKQVPDVKDTKHKHSLLYHVVMIVMKQFPDGTDLHSDLGTLNRCHRLDWEELARKLQKLKNDCKKCWDHLRLIFRSDQTNADVITKLKKFYWEASETIVKMDIIHRRVIKRFEKMLEYLGFPSREAQTIKVRDFCRIISDFAIEYRTTKEKFDQLEEKKEKEKERRKTRGAMITDHAQINSLDRNKRTVPNHEHDLMSAIMSRNTLGNSDCESDFNTLNNRRARRLTHDSPSPGFPRPSSSHQIHAQDSSPSASSMTPAVSELNLDQSDIVLDQLVQQAASSNNKRRTNRRSCVRERKSMRRTKPTIDEDIIRNIQLEMQKNAVS